MALSRRLFIGGLLASAAAPAIITSKGFKPAVARGYTGSYFPIDEAPFYRHAGISTGRMTFSEPAWQDFHELSKDARPYQREAIKQIMFGARYGTLSTIAASRGTGKSMLNLDYSELELRVIADRANRDLFRNLR